MIEQKFKVALLLDLYNKIGSCLSYLCLYFEFDHFNKHFL